MLVEMLKCKVHGVVVTESFLEYDGSLTVDRDIMERVKLIPFEKILIANMENGERFETYIIPGEAGSKVICLNGATAHKGEVGDRLIIFAFCQLEDADATAHKPLVLRYDDDHPDGVMKQV